jgi:hypothetical protein
MRALFGDEHAAHRFNQAREQYLHRLSPVLR